MATTSEQLLCLLEETANLLQNTQTNIKKCPKARLTRGYVETRLECIEQYWASYKVLHQKLVECTPKEKRESIPYFKDDKYFAHEDIFLCTCADLKDLLLSSASRTNRSVAATCDDQASSLQVKDVQVKLPRIQLPTFSGSYEEWLTFNDLFTSLVHNNSTLSKVQKLHYLKSSVSGEAEVLLRHIQVTENNYDQAWSILKDRFGNKRLIINSLMKRLFSQKKINTSSANQIKTLLDSTSECLNSLETLGLSVWHWDQVIIHLVVQRLDTETHKAWEEYSYDGDSNKLPKWQDLRTFLETKFRTLELVTPPSSSVRDRQVRERVFHTTNPTPRTKSCIKCNENHTLCHCKEFSQMQTDERRDYVKNNNLCFNCLLEGHSAHKCRLQVFCRICHRRHHSLLHLHENKREHTHKETATTHVSQVNDDTSNVTNDNETHITMTSHFTTKRSTAVLATALVPVRDEKGNKSVLRALIDQGSQASFITERAAQLMQIKRTPMKGTITGVGSTTTSINQVVQLEVLSRYDGNFNLKVKAYVMATRLTAQLPSKAITSSTHNWPHLHGLTLADPSYHQPGRIDLLLGVDVYARILKNDVIKGPPGSPCAQDTRLGWILFGDIDESSSEDIVVMHHQVNIDTMLRDMWELQSSTKPELTANERKCEEIYKKTTARTNEGRYIVKLPTKEEEIKSTQGETREIALRRFHLLERKFERNETFSTEYKNVIHEYLDLDHMEEVPKNELNKPSVYLPHHAVVKTEKETSKVRVVFDASSKGKNDVSLNDDLLVGPQLQEDMRSLIMRWRMKRICFIADVKQMYRQILVTKEDADLQRIVWRDNTKDTIKDYRLLRVTFGTASAPYLAVKTLQQTAEDYTARNEIDSLAVKTIKEDFYVDDLMSGQDTLRRAIDVAKTTADILRMGGFTLQKWTSNSAEFLSHFQQSERSTLVSLNAKIDGTIRALGITWNIGEDAFQYEFNLPSPPERITKRNILAETLKLFDPLGWLAPSTIMSKMLIQKLWLQRTSWDDEVEPENKKEWLEIRQSYEDLKEIKINRWLQTTTQTDNDITIHGFCDASTKAFGAVAYVRVKKDNGQYETSLIAAKARVAPVKPVSLPRLELCGATLLAKLLKQIREAMRIPETAIFAWTDSTIVLSWLKGDPTRWQTFVRNRVISILDDIGSNWYHVRTQDNPADVASRGMVLSELLTRELWWKGPHWLSTDNIPFERPDNVTNLEMRNIIEANLKIENKECEQFEGITSQFEKFDTLPELLRTITYCKRFLNYKKFNTPSMLTPTELEGSLKSCIRLIQEQTYREEIEALRENKQVKRSSTLKSLNPYIDSEGIIRVGGRLRHSNLNEESKHPMILDNKSKLTTLIVADAHQRTLHGGPQLMLAYLRTKFWIVKPKGIVKRHVHKCLTCARQSATAKNQVMGDLPKQRVVPARPFLHSGVDFAGPYSILMSKGRGMKTSKAYISIFVCMATRAVHLELVGDMTTEAFIGAFRRFVSRRGKCTHLWSDQGRNFIGANKELADAFQEAKLQFDVEIANTLSSDGTQWHFIPAYSPNFGGIWESGVRSMKYHLKRILNSNVTFEEMSTILCQIEACLNSRPLSPIDDSDTENIEVLTPGHFLIGEPPITVPSPDMSNITVSNLSRWHYMQKLLSDFWHRWQQEYLSRLQQRPKWLKITPDLEIGQIVLIKNEYLPPGKWLLGRIVDKHPGADGLTRVYSVKSGTSVVKRSISKLCKLPISSESDNDKQ